jgi:hypothetical protein
MGLISALYDNSCLDRYRVTAKDVLSRLGSDWKPVGNVVREIAEAKGTKRRHPALFVANAYRRLRMLAEEGKVERRQVGDLGEYRLVATKGKIAEELPTPQAEDLMKKS